MKKRKIYFACKSTQEKNESIQETAIEEVSEETGIYLKSHKRSWTNKL